MTQIGHILTGATCGVLCVPASVSKTRCAVQLVIFAVLANVPDIPLPSWGHARYDISHSIFANLALCAPLACAGLMRFSSLRDGRAVGFGIAAWFSHLLLDMFYNHGSGLAIFWPFSTVIVALPIPWFSVVRAPLWPLTAEEIRIGLIELMSYGPVFLVAIGIRMRERGRGQDLAFEPSRAADTSL
jgi:membrane-bound metal-dependent hydrolase YbcI (DUF457 family)